MSPRTGKKPCPWRHSASASWFLRKVLHPWDGVGQHHTFTFTFTSAAQQWVMACDREHSPIQAAARGGTLHHRIDSSSSNRTVTEKLIWASKCQQGGVMPLTTQTLHLHTPPSSTLSSDGVSSLSFINPRTPDNRRTILHLVNPTKHNCIPSPSTCTTMILCWSYRAVLINPNLIYCGFVALMFLGDSVWASVQWAAAASSMTCCATL